MARVTGALLTGERTRAVVRVLMSVKSVSLSVPIAEILAFDLTRGDLGFVSVTKQFGEAQVTILQKIACDPKRPGSCRAVVVAAALSRPDSERA